MRQCVIFVQPRLSLLESSSEAHASCIAPLFAAPAP